MAIKIIGAVIVLQGALWGTLFGTGIATIDNYHGTYGVSIGTNSVYCSVDVTPAEIVGSASCQNGNGF